MRIRGKGDPWLVAKSSDEQPTVFTPAHERRREFWKYGHSTLKSMITCVDRVASSVAKHEGGSVADALQMLHKGLGPIYRTVRQLMRDALPDAQVDQDEELKRLRAEIDGNDEMSTHVNSGTTTPVDDGPTDVYGNPRRKAGMLDGQRIRIATPQERAMKQRVRRLL